MEPAERAPRRRARRAGTFFLRHPASSTATLVAHDSVKGLQVLEPLFEFSGACSGCGETPYLQARSRQLFGDRMVIANATGCSSIYGGNLPTTPWIDERRRPRPGLGQLAVRGQRRVRARACGSRSNATRRRRAACSPSSAARSAPDVAARPPRRRPADRGRTSPPSASGSPRCRTARRDRRLARPGRPPLLERSPTSWSASSVDRRRRRLGLRHRLRRRSTTCSARGRNVNMLVLDTEVYSNTGGQASKATPRGAVAKFADRRQGHREEGPRRDRPGLRQRLRRPGRARRAATTRP